MRTGKALYHIITESLITDFVDKEFLVSLDNLLHVGALMVEVTHSAPAFAFVIIGTQRETFLISLSECSATVIISYNVSRQHLVSFTVPSLCRECKPSGSITVIDNDIGNSANTFILESLYHRLQLVDGSKR